MDNSPVITEIKSRIINSIKQNKLHRRVIAVFIFGGSTEDFLEGRELSTDEIDLMFVIKGRLKPGECPLEKTLFEHFCDGLSLRGKDTVVIFNGIPPLGYSGSVFLLDVIGDGLRNIEEKAPFSVVNAYKPRILIFGSDVYKQLESEPFTGQMKKVVFEGMDKYVRKEFFGRRDQYAKKAIAKNAIFGASLLSGQAVKTNAKHEIISIISKKFAPLRKYLTTFERAYYEPEKVDKRSLIKRFDEFSSSVQGMIIGQ